MTRGEVGMLAAASFVLVTSGLVLLSETAQSYKVPQQSTLLAPPPVALFCYDGVVYAQFEINGVTSVAPKISRVNRKPQLCNWSSP